AIDRWSALGRFAWADEMEILAVEMLFGWLLGMHPDPADVRLVYANIFAHPLPGLARLWPGSTYARSLPAYRRLLAQVRAAPGFAAAAGRAADHGLAGDDDALAKQLLFLLGMNAFLGTQCMLKIIVGELGAQAGLADRLRAEIAGVDTADLAALAGLPLLDRALREMMRLHPPVTFIFGRVVRPCVIASASGRFAVAAGELLMGVLPFVQRDPAIFPDPDRFDPNRASSAAAAAHLVWPRGAQDAVVTPGDRTCPGKDIALLIGKAACAALVRCRWRLDAPVTWAERRFSLNVAAPEGPLAVSGFARRDA
ncbi:MAG: cytochrome P450, partial [Sphingomonas sp.]